VPKSSSSSSGAIPFRSSSDKNDAPSSTSTSASSPTPSSTSTTPPPSAAADDPMLPYRRSQAAAMLRFMAPAALIPLADPLLTLVDVLFVSHGGDLLVSSPGRAGVAGLVGRALSLSGATATEQLAALSPNAQIFTFIQYMLGGLGE
jgi:Na+-driven multidrug efflux pump